MVFAMEHNQDNQDVQFVSERSLDGLFAALRHLRQLTPDLFNNGSFIIEIRNMEQGFTARLCEYSEDRVKRLKDAAVSYGEADTGCNDDLVTKLYQDMSGRENDVCYLFESYGHLVEYYI